MTDMNSSPSNAPPRPNFPSPFSSYVASSIRMQGPRFNYYTPSPYPRPRSSASKPNPSFHGENIDFPNTNDCSTPPHNPMFRGDQSFNMHHSDAKDVNYRFKDNGYESPNSEYYSCSDGSFMSPMTPNSVRSSFSASGYPGRSNQQQSTPRRFYKPNFGSEKNGVGPTGIKRPLSEKADYTANFSQGEGCGDQYSDMQQPTYCGYPLPPNKKSKISYRCNLCNLDFTSQIPYNMHLMGAKHSKKLKAEEHMKTLQNQGQISETNQKNPLCCEMCEVVVNSYQQMQMHLDGTKHKNKSKKLNMPEEENTTSPPEETQKSGEETENATTETKAVEESTVRKKIPNFPCEVCSLSLNSETQLQQHQGSKRHQAKLEGKPLPRKKKSKKATNEGTSTETEADTPAVDEVLHMEKEEKPFKHPSFDGQQPDSQNEPTVHTLLEAPIIPEVIESEEKKAESDAPKEIDGESKIKDVDSVGNTLDLSSVPK